MRSTVLMLLALGCASDKPGTSQSAEEPVDLLAHVDPLISTGGIGFGVGSGYPGAATPFGLVKVSPDTATANGTALGFHHCGGYHADDTHVEGFSHLHLHGIGVPAHGVLTMMPVDGWDETMKDPDGYRAAMDKDTEDAEPGWYTVTLANPEIQVDLSATPHTALHRYRFSDEVETPTVLIDLAHTLDGGEVQGTEIEVDPTGAVRGWAKTDGALGGSFEYWFEARFDPPPADWGTWEQGAWLRFDADEVYARVAVSLVDGVGAKTNLAEEHRVFDMDQSVDDAQDEWREWLKVFRVWGGTEADRTIFATALYHTLQMPTDVTDVDGRYRGFDDQIHTAQGFRYRTDFSLWDTYRTTHPLYTLAWPQTHLEMLHSLARMVRQGGALPRWPLAMSDSGSMIGEPATIVAAEAWQKGLRGFDEVDIYRSAVEVSLGRWSPPYGGPPRPDLYQALGYYPSDAVGGSVAWTQERAIAHHALAAMAVDLGTAKDARALSNQSTWWKNLWDEDAGYFHGRLADGSFEPPPQPGIWEPEFVEGTARQYLWLAPQDPEALFEVLGGEEATLARLDEMMIEGEAEADLRDQGIFGTWYWHGNEPGLHIPWLFALAGDRDSTRYWVDHLLSTAYGTGPDGLSGNDDGGTLSAWAVFASMGIYPLAGTDRYVLGQPRFDRIELQPAGGSHVLTLVRSTDGPDGLISVGEEEWDRPDIHHAELMEAQSIEFVVN